MFIHNIIREIEYGVRRKRVVCVVLFFFLYIFAHRCRRWFFLLVVVFIFFNIYFCSVPFLPCAHSNVSLHVHAIYVWFFFIDITDVSSRIHHLGVLSYISV